MVGQPRDACELPLDAPIPARGPDQVEVLVEPDRQMRTQPQDQRMRDPRLPLRQRMRPRFIDTTKRPPAPGEVAVQIDPVRVLTSAGSNTVRIQVGDNPKIKIVR